MASSFKFTAVFGLILSIYCSNLIGDVQAVGKVVCYYNGKAAIRKDLAKVTAEDLVPALDMCNYLIYGYAGIDDDKYKVQALDKDLELSKGQGHYKKVTDLKRFQPTLKVLLSVGGFEDLEEVKKYLKLLENSESRGKFIASVVQLVKDYNFDGVDLAWEFPVIKEKKERSTVGSIWHSVKKTVTGSTKDDKEKEHKDQFTTLVKELSTALRGERRILTLTILPHVNYPVYFDGPSIKDFVEQFHLMTHDYRTPERVEDEADYAAPIHYVYNRVGEQNIEAEVKWWLEHGVPATKIIISVPTFGRSWKMTSDSGKSGVPPVKVEGPGEPGTFFRTEGLLAYYEICPNLVSVTVAKSSTTALRKVTDPTFRQGTYAFRLPTDNNKGLWTSYEDPEVAAKKAQYARLKGLGGVAVVDLSLDDFKGSCDLTHTKFPILKAVKVNI